MPTRPERARLRSTQLVARESGSISVTPRKRAQVAWARERGTERLTYIGELPRERTGLNCNCECYGCGQPLEAVNAGVIDGKRAQHFRHHGDHNCSERVAQATLLNRLGDIGTLKLPPRHFVGLSKRIYVGPDSHQNFEVEVVSRAAVHEADAVLTLADGSQIAIRLRGAVAAQDDGSLLPTIVIDTPPGLLANCTPDELRSRIQVLVAEGEWCGPPLAALRVGAGQNRADYGLADALEALDAVPDEAVPHIGRSPTYETLLHWTAKHLIASMTELYVPSICVAWEPAYDIAEIHDDSCEIERHWRLVDSAQVEAVLEHTRPDILLESSRRDGRDSYQIAIEVTVANAIDVERRSRIQAAGIACLEFDLSRLPRDITRTRLADLLANDYWLKRWVHHPAEQPLRESLEQRVAEVDEQTIASALLNAYVDIRTYEFRIRRGPGNRDAYEEGQQIVAVASELLAARGHPHVAWTVSENGIRTVLDRLLALSRGRAIGEVSGRPADLFRQLEMDSAERSVRGFHVYYLMAFKAYGRSVDEKDQERFDRWADSVRRGYRRDDSRYFAIRRYDKLFGLLFPEMKPLLAYRPKPKEAAVQGT